MTRAAPARVGSGSGTVPRCEPVTTPRTAACAGEPVATRDSGAASSRGRVDVPLPSAPSMRTNRPGATARSAPLSTQGPRGP
ncbi:hypothetical protein [Streptomyces sp. NPDC007984]|uniref:hypothetical protein n=1 Tax=Streptomyces sp. NPDC007984 TaxID=3364801 RepID=UPI0036E84483